MDVSVLSCLLGWSAPLEECRFINDDLAAIEKNIQAFHRIGPAPVLEGKASLDELRRAIKDLGLHGVTITSQVNGLPLDSPKRYPLYETVMELDGPIFVHPPSSPLATNS